MIQKLKGILSWLKPPVEPPVEQVVKQDIYSDLRVNLNLVLNTKLDMSRKNVFLGNIESYSETLSKFNRSLMEVIDVLKKREHIQNGLFYVKDIKSVKLDHFLFVENGFYINNIDDRVMISLDLIQQYLNIMSEAGDAKYGFMEHNHRQLYNYTLSINDYLERLLHFFGE